jgi:hypothetical protein
VLTKKRWNAGAGELFIPTAEFTGLSLGPAPGRKPILFSGWPRDTNPLRTAASKTIDLQHSSEQRRLSNLDG